MYYLFLKSPNNRTIELGLIKSDMIVPSSSINVFNNSLVKVLGGLYILQTKRFFHYYYYVILQIDLPKY